jgi:enoyl-CoA hydratase
MQTCKDLAGRIAKNSPRAISAALSSVLANYKDGVNGFDKEIEEFGKCFGTEDFKEGTSAFLNKEKPNFKGK